jgi:hypothetical protein
VSEATTFQVWDGNPVMWSHHSLRDCKCHSCWLIKAIPSHSLMRSKSLRWTYNTQRGVLPIPWLSCIKDIIYHLATLSFSNLSVVHNLFLRASQARDFVFEGAHTFQTILFILEKLHKKIGRYKLRPQSIEVVHICCVLLSSTLRKRWPNMCGSRVPLTSCSPEFRITQPDICLVWCPSVALTF